MVHGFPRSGGFIGVRESKFRHCWKRMRMHLKTWLGIVGIAVGTIVLLLLLIGQFRPLRAEAHRGLIEWTPLRSSSPSAIEIDPKHRWVAQMERGWKGWLRVWRLKEDLTIGEEVLNIGGRKGAGFFVDDIEWVGERLLISIVKGYDTYLEWDKGAEEVIDEKGRPTLVFGVIKPWEIRWLIFEPKTRQLIDLGINEDLIDGKLFAHPLGDRVLIVKAGEGGAFGTRKVRVVSLSTAALKPEIVSELSFSYKEVGRFLFPEYWFPNGQGFWAIGTDEHGHGKLFSVNLNGSIKKLTPDDHHLLHPRAQATQGLAYEGGLEVDALEGVLPSVVTLKGELAILMSFPKREHEHVCIGYHSHERLKRETVILDVNKPYPKVLKPLEECVLKAVVPDDHRLILQEGKVAPRGENYGEKRRVWVWDIKGKTVTPVAQVGWITQIYGWLKDKWMVVEMKGEPIQVEIEYDIGGKRIEQRATYEYGLLHVP